MAVQLIGTNDLAARSPEYLDELVNDYPFDLAVTLGAEPVP